jgi:hypothetical protein
VSVVDSGQRGARGCNGDCEGDVVGMGCGAVASNVSCGALAPGLSEVMTWLRKSVEGEDPEPVCDRLGGCVIPSVNMD